MVQPYMDFLQDFLNRNPVRSVVDIGCGDWQFSQFIDWGERSYRGIDVVAEVIRENNARFATPTISFECVNPLDAGFEAGGDLLLMKDVLQHLSNDNVLRLLALTKRFRFSLITNAFGRENADCENGDTRPLDIRAAPFNLAQAVLAGTFHEKAVFVVTNPA